MTDYEKIFLDELYEFLENEYLCDMHDDNRYFDKCKARVDLDNGEVKVRNLSFFCKDSDGYPKRVDDALSYSEIKITFQNKDINPSNVSWDKFLTQLVVLFSYSEHDLPYPLKWEAKGDEYGDLKEVEFDDTKRQYIEKRIEARSALKKAIEKLLYDVVPTFEFHSKIRDLKSAEVKLKYEDKHEIIGNLKNTDLKR